MATLPDIPLDEELKAIYEQARNVIAGRVRVAVENGETVDISKTLSDLSELEIDKLTQVTMKLSRELVNRVHEETDERQKNQYRECLTQIFSQQISPQVAEEFNSNTDAAIKTLISSQYNRTYFNSEARIERIKDLTHQLLSQKSSVQSGQTITYSQLQARELLIRKLTKTQGKKQTKELIDTIKGKATHYQNQTKGQEATSTENAPSRVTPVIASKNMDLLGEANNLVLNHCNPRRENNNP